MVKCESHLLNISSTLHGVCNHAKSGEFNRCWTLLLEVKSNNTNPTINALHQYFQRETLLTRFALNDPIRFYGTLLDRPLRRELEKVFLTPGASCAQIDPHILWIFILQAQRKTHTPKCKVSKGMKWVPFLVPGQERFERFETQRDGVWQNCKIASKTFPSLLPPNGTLGHPWSLEILSLWMDHQVCGRRKNVKKLRLWSSETTADHHMVTSSPRKWLNS